MANRPVHPTPAPTKGSRELTPELVEAYRSMMMPVEPDDWDALRTKVDAATRTATRAFVEQDRGAWEVIQLVCWRLQRRSSFRPTKPADVHVLDTIYRIEDSTLPPVELPRGLSPKAFCEKLASEIRVYSALETESVNIMGSGKLTMEDWKYFAYSWVAPVDTFAPNIALAALRLPHRAARVLYLNLYDECGGTKAERGHWALMERFVHQFGVKTDDQEDMLYWTHPDHLAFVNRSTQHLWHENPGWALGSILLPESLLPVDLVKIRSGLIASGVPRDSLAWFDEHIEVDVGHSEDWLAVIEGFLVDYEDQKIVWRAAMDRGRWWYRTWECLAEGWKEWKETGTPPHVPAKRLRELTGL